MKRLFKQFSFPGGIPSHAAPRRRRARSTKGASWATRSRHAYGAAFDNPDLLVACVVGDGEAETGPLATSWHSNKFLNPVQRRRGAADPAPERLQDRRPDRAGAHPPRGAGATCSAATAITPYFVEGDEPAAHAPADGRDARQGRRPRSGAIQDRGPQPRASRQRPRWPMIVLRTPKGWTGPKVVDGQPVEGTFRAHQVPIGEHGPTPSICKLLEEWMKSYRPEELFDERGRLRPELAELAPKGDRRMGANPARQRRHAAARSAAARFPRLRRRRAPAGQRSRPRPRACMGEFLRDVDQAQRREPQLPRLRPRRDRPPTAGRRLRGHRRQFGGHDPADRRSRRRRRPGDGDAQRASVPGLAGRLSAHRPARLLLLLRGLHPHRRFDVQPARQVAEGDPRTFPGGGRSPRSTTCSPRTSGGRTTTASAIRTPASSTTW